MHIVQKDLTWDLKNMQERWNTFSPKHWLFYYFCCPCMQKCLPVCLACWILVDKWVNTNTALTFLNPFSWMRTNRAAILAIELTETWGWSFCYKICKMTMKGYPFYGNLYGVYFKLHLRTLKLFKFIHNHSWKTFRSGFFGLHEIPQTKILEKQYLNVGGSSTTKHWIGQRVIDFHFTVGAPSIWYTRDISCWGLSFQGTLNE